ncbi:MAG: thiamine phosphate synthase [Sphingomicrobium sp.]
MAANQSLWPREWLMTDERFGERLWRAIGALPADAGIVFRHYAAPEDERARLAHLVAQICRERGLTLAVARDATLADSLGAQLVHNPVGDPGGLPCSMAVHDDREARAAEAAGAALTFVAPIFATRSHPGARALGPEPAAHLARLAGCPAIALGGMNAERFAQLDAAHPGIFHGYAGIDCWLR